MGADAPPTPAPVVLRIKVRYEQPEAFVERFAPYVGRAGLFLRSKVPKPVGTEVRFELRLATDAPVLVGMGVVRWMRMPDPDRPNAPPGMAIEFTRVTKESRGVILLMLELRKKLGMADGPRGMPNPPDDTDAVTAASTASATAVAVAAETIAAAPPVEVPEPVTPQPSAPLTSWQRPAVPGGLEPLIVKPRRPSPAELVSAMSSGAGNSSGGSGAMSDAFGDIDVEQADLPGVLARARAMVGADADAELARLLDDDAAPMEITIEEASARLAHLLGTAPVRARRARGDDSVPVESKPVFVAPPRVTSPVAAAAAAASIATDFVAARPDADAEPPAATVIPVASRPPPDDEPPVDPDRTKVVSVATLAALTAQPGEGETRVVSLDALAAASARDPEERTQVRHAFAGDDARTKVISTRDIARQADDLDDTLDFDRPRPALTGAASAGQAPHDYGDEFDQDTAVKARPLPPSSRGASPPRAHRDAPQTDTAHDDAPTPPPIARPPRPGTRPRAESSGSIDITDLVAELDAEAAAPVPLDGTSLGGEALDPAGLIADLDGIGRRHTPDGPFPDLASFANPPAQFPRRAERADSLEAALAALELGEDPVDDASEEPTSLGRPSTSPSGVRAAPEPPAVKRDDDDDDDEIEIEIELDD